jgi:hypothetical protein
MSGNTAPSGCLHPDLRCSLLGAEWVPRGMDNSRPLSDTALVGVTLGAAMPSKDADER